MRNIEPMVNDELIFIKLISTKTNEFHYLLLTAIAKDFQNQLALKYETQFEEDGLFTQDWKKTKAGAERLEFRIKVIKENITPKDRHNVKAPNGLYQYNTDYSEYNDYTATRNASKY